MKFVGGVTMIAGLAALLYGGFHEAHTMADVADAFMLQAAGAIACCFGGLAVTH
jgi:hypothetical protein